MKKIFIGYLLAAFTFSITLSNTQALGIPPPFVGVGLMAWGCREMKPHSRRFAWAAVFGAVLSVLLVGEWFAQLTGTLGANGVGLSSLTSLLRLVFDLLWIWGIGDVEKKFSTGMQGGALRVLWLLQFVTAGLTLLGLLASILIIFTAVGVMAATLLSVVFLVKLFKSWKAWDYLQRRGVVK